MSRLVCKPLLGVATIVMGEDKFCGFLVGFLILARIGGSTFLLDFSSEESSVFFDLGSGVRGFWSAGATASGGFGDK